MIPLGPHLLRRREGKEEPRRFLFEGFPAHRVVYDSDNPGLHGRFRFRNGRPVPPASVHRGLSLRSEPRYRWPLGVGKETRIRGFLSSVDFHFPPVPIVETDGSMKMDLQTRRPELRNSVNGRGETRSGGVSSGRTGPPVVQAHSGSWWTRHT